MKGLVVAVKNQDELKFLTDLFKKLGVASSAVSSDELEDIGLSRMLKTVDRSRKASRESVLKKLKS